MHDTEDKKDDANLVAEDLDRFHQIVRFLIRAQHKGDVSDVDQVEPDHQQMIHGIGKGVIAVKCVEKKNAAATMKRVCDPYGNGEADCQVDEIALNDHDFSFARRDRVPLRARWEIRT